MRFFRRGEKKNLQPAQVPGPTAATRTHSFNPAPRGSVDDGLPRSRSQGRAAVVVEEKGDEKLSGPDAELQLAMRRVGTMVEEEDESKGAQSTLTDGQRRLGSMLTEPGTVGAMIEETAGSEEQGALAGATGQTDEEQGSLAEATEQTDGKKADEEGKCNKGTEDYKGSKVQEENAEQKDDAKQRVEEDKDENKSKDDDKGKTESKSKEDDEEETEEENKSKSKVSDAKNENQSKEDDKEKAEQENKAESNGDKQDQAEREAKDENEEEEEEERENVQDLPDLPDAPESLAGGEAMPEREAMEKDEEAEREKENQQVLPDVDGNVAADEAAVGKSKGAAMKRLGTRIAEDDEMDDEMDRGLTDAEQRLVLRRVGTMAEEADDLALLRSDMLARNRARKRHSSCPAFTRTFDEEECKEVNEEKVADDTPASAAIDRSFGSMFVNDTQSIDRSFGSMATHDTQAIERSVGSMVTHHDAPVAKRNFGSSVIHDPGTCERSFGSMVAHAGGLLESDAPSSDDDSPRAGGAEGRDRLNSMFTLFGGERQELAQSFLQQVRSHFGECDRDGDGEISREELARAWAAVTESELGRSMDLGERELLALSVQKAFREMDVDGDGRISADEWVHHALLDLQPPGSAAKEAIAKAAKSLGSWSDIGGILRQWEKADTDMSGTLSRSEVAAMLRMSTEEEAEEAVGRMKAEGVTGDVSYAEFCAYKLGLKFQPVELYLYDLSASVSKYLSPLLLGKYMEGIWHSSIVVYGSEYYLFGYLERDAPGTTHFGKPTKKMSLGHTLRSQSDLGTFIRMKMTDCTPDKYDLLRHNCNHAAERIAQFLLGRSLPDSVRLMSESLVNTPLVRVIEPLVYKFTGGGSEEDFAIRQAAIAAKAKPDLRRARSQTNLANRKQIEDATSGAIVLYRAPEQAAPVMARLLRQYKDGSADVSWIDGAGVCHRVSRVHASKLQKQRTADRPRTRSFAEVKEALEKRSEERRMDCPRSDAMVALPSTPSLKEVQCKKGHAMVRRSGQSAWGRANCSSCSLKELGSSAPYFYSCERCNSHLCPSCAETTG